MFPSLVATTPRSILCCTLAVSWLLAASELTTAHATAPATADDGGGTVASLAAQVQRAFVEADGDAMRSAHDRLATLEESTEPAAHYTRGLAQLLLTVLGEAGEDAMVALDEALLAFDQAQALGRDDVPFYVTRIWCQALRMRTNAECTATAQPGINADARAAMALDGNHPALQFLIGMSSAGNGMASFATLQDLEQTLADMAEQREEGAGADWFELFGYLNVARGYIALGDQGIERAQAVYAQGLQLEPDFALLQQLIPPQLEAFDETPASVVADLTWTELTTDAGGDGTSDADATALAWSYDPATDRDWFRFTYAERGDHDRVSVNLAFDTDGDPANGASWWSGATDFQLDRVATLWVTRTDDDRWRGLVGMTDAAHANAMIMNTISSNTLALCVEDDWVAVGIPRSEISTEPARATRVLGAVGLGMNWSDDVGEPARLAAATPATAR